MNRFLTVASSTLIASGLAILPVASFAQTAADATKTPAPAAQTAPTAKTPVVTQDKTPVKTEAGKTDSAAMAKPGKAAPVAGKTTTAPAHHNAAKTPVKDGVVKG